MATPFFHPNRASSIGLFAEPACTGERTPHTSLFTMALVQCVLALVFGSAALGVVLLTPDARLSGCALCFVSVCPPASASAQGPHPFHHIPAVQPRR